VVTNGPPLRGDVTSDNGKRKYVLAVDRLLFKVGTWRTYISGSMHADGSGMLRVYRVGKEGRETTLISERWGAEERKVA
jgi:hypothetical protein